MRRLTIGLTAALVIGATFPALASAAYAPLTLNVYIGDNCIRGRAADHASVNVVLRDSGGTLKSSQTVTAAANGSFTACSNSQIVEIADQIHVNDGIHDARDVTVPELTLYQNRDTNVYKGRGPAGQYVTLICGLSNGFEPCSATWKLKVNAQGQWGYKPGWDVRGDEDMGLRWKDVDGDVFNVWNTSPFVSVTIGQAAVTGAARAGSSATVVLMKGNTLDVRGTAYPVGAPGYGTFKSKFLTTGGSKAKVHVGDHVTSDIASDADFIVSNITATANVSTGHVVGDCVPDSLWFMGIYRNGELIDGADWRFDSDTHFNENFSSLPLMAGDRVLISCQLPTRDVIQKWFTAS